MTSQKRVSFIELALKKCQNIYGVFPCTAAIGVTGDQPCFNSRATCQSKADLFESEEIVRFAKPSSNIRFDLEATPNSYLPNIQSINYTPVVVDLGRSLGERGSLTITFRDHRSPDTDASGDDYIIARDYDPYERGTYWGKFRARHPFIRGQSIWWVQGTSDQLVEDMERQEFIVESTTGPDTNGTYTITAKDALKLTQGDRATAPVASLGSLQNAITAGTTVAQLTPTGVGATYPVSGTAAVGGVELVSFTRSGDALTLVRGQGNTDAVAHDVDSQFQLCLVYSAQKPSAIFEDLLVNYTPIPAEKIPSADWENESDTQLNRVYSTVIARPTPVTQLVNELLEQTASSMYWDSFRSLIRWTVLKDPGLDADLYEERVVLRDSFNIRDQLAERVSQVWVYYGQINPLLNLDDLRNYASKLATISVESEDNFDGVPSYRQIYSRWILGDARDTASRLAELILSRYATPPRKLGFRLLRGSLPSLPALAGAYQFQHSFIQDITGASVPIPIQVTSVNFGEADITVVAEEVTFSAIEPQDPDDVNLYPSDGTLNYNIYDAYFAQVGQAPTATTVVNVYVESGFTLGSASAAFAGLNTGSGWPVGATINLTNNGRLLGRGGDGGAGGDLVVRVLGDQVLFSLRLGATSGGDGGDGFEVQDPNVTVNLTNNGIIGGGGGGGGGSGVASVWGRAVLPGSNFDTLLAAVGGSGGSGGAGFPAGSGGAGKQETVQRDAASAGRYPRATRSGAIVGGLAGGELSGGAGPAAVIEQGSGGINPGNNFSLSATSSDGGGYGGDLGMEGGGGFFGATTLVKNGVGATGETFSSIGAGSGAAGRAIVQNGNLINILVAGDIRGAVV